MPKLNPVPHSLTRSYETRSEGIFRKAAQLHNIDDSVRISIIIEKLGHVPSVFSTEEIGHSFMPDAMNEYVRIHRPLVKRPSHFLTLSEGISRGRAKMVRNSSISPSPSPPALDNSEDRSQTLGGLEDGEGEFPWNLRSSTSYASPSRHQSPLPPRKSIVLPSKRARLPRKKN